MNEREMLMKRVQMCEFVLYDASLYLDTHPEDQMALGYYKKYLALREKTKKEYTEKFGPLVHYDAAAGDRWTWSDGPWPWQEKEDLIDVDL